MPAEALHYDAQFTDERSRRLMVCNGYLHGLSSGDFVPALEQFLGSAKGLSAAMITKLTGQRLFAERDLSDVDYVYPWADGVHVKIRLEELCLLAMIGARADELLASYDHPAEHRDHLRTTDPIESIFATVRHRTEVTKGPGSRAAGLAMAFKLIESAQARRRVVDAPHLVALVRAGALFRDGVLVERPEQDAA
ncbi:hypothetical protein BS329_31070 [Amycolatopsis coloradensis]|uniref:Transposase n=1 Tax=Amycolatopsis coloradensis TaxID=76021 RepID=A0A1R0KJA4_9PSEU|nr:hypothetical protein BS329_31070 [Amycolatopsis coloradensis]